ncbi:T9SS C-terminal target domain-containing protein [candidate division KSB1 bacterium]|nr:MAG: T9SS C-terminal target domain-containing protein [candidate division KSB1 bacterium]
MAPESFQFRRTMSDPILNDPIACANLDIVGGHVYGAGLAPYPLAMSKGKEIWMTEHYTDSENSANLWPLALNVGTEMNDVMNAGMNAYIWWYIVRFYGPISDGTKDSGKKGEVTKRGYVMSQFSRFIRPGYFRIQCDRHPQSSIYTSAYRDSTSSKVVIVAINSSSAAKTQTFTFQDGRVDMFTPYVTSETKNCAQEDDIIVANSSLAVTLDGKSITTLLSRGNVKINVENAPSSVPASSRLWQNYPNPFNPSTRITFEIAEKSFVSLRVYNILGEEMGELAGRAYDAGAHSVLFDASRLPNGIYLYTLRAGDFLSTRKMIFAK